MLYLPSRKGPKTSRKLVVTFPFLKKSNFQMFFHKSSLRQNLFFISITSRQLCIIYKTQFLLEIPETSSTLLKDQGFRDFFV